MSGILVSNDKACTIVTRLEYQLLHSQSGASMMSLQQHMLPVLFHCACKPCSQVHQQYSHPLPTLKSAYNFGPLPSHTSLHTLDMQ